MRGGPQVAAKMDVVARTQALTLVHWRRGDYEYLYQPWGNTGMGEVTNRGGQNGIEEGYDLSC